MSLLRYAFQESRNIAAAEKRSRQVSALQASIAARRAEAEIVALTKDDVGLSDVDNTSDADKPVSTATQAALAGKLGWTAVPATATDPGTAGQVAYASGFLYVCTATNTWKRAALSTW